MKVIGFDGYKAGWVGVRLGDEGVLGVETGPTVASVLDAHGPFDVVGVDMPIGLPQGRLRAADGLARKMIGGRASSVFATPPRVCLDALDYESANAVSKADCGKGLSKQAYMLLEKIREIDALVRGGGHRIVEVHPEVSFRALNEAEVPFYKKTWNGQMLRRRLLAAAGVVLPDQLEGEAGKVPVDDVLDAAVVAWSARRVALGVARALPEVPEVDAEGVQMAIWY